jgi:hypothetical protein
VQIKQLLELEDYIYTRESNQKVGLYLIKLLASGLILRMQQQLGYSIDHVRKKQVVGAEFYGNTQEFFLFANFADCDEK